jgi:hypothetical protein
MFVQYIVSLWVYSALAVKNGAAIVYGKVYYHLYYVVVLCTCLYYQEVPEFRLFYVSRTFHADYIPEICRTNT